MSVVAMESQCMKIFLQIIFKIYQEKPVGAVKTIMIHFVDKSDFTLSDHKTHCKSLQ